MRTTAPRVGALARFAACCCLALAATAADPWITGYVWAGNSWEDPSQVPYAKYSHIIHVGVDAAADGTIDASGIPAAESAAVVAGAHAAGTKAILGMSPNGGQWGADTSAGTIDTFVANMLGLMRSRGYDGVDLDWEESIDVQQYANLIRKLRAALHPGEVLTLAAYGGGDSPMQACVAAGADQLDQINIMCYDEDIWAPFTWFVTAARQGPDGQSSVEAAWDEFIAAGLPAAKLGIGIAYYGRHYTGANGPKQTGATRAGWTTYHDLVTSGLLAPANDHYDATYGGAWLSPPGSSDFYPYTSTRELGEIVAFGKAHGAGGYMTFLLDYEYLPDATGDARYPLSTALRDAAGGTVVAQPPSIASFAATPASVAAGVTATLSWSTANATGVSIDHGVGTVAASGTVSVTPTSTTTYTLTATGSGSPAVATTTVTVTAAPPAPVISGHVYEVIAEHSGKALDVAGASTADGANVQQWTYGGGANQRWRVTANADGSFTLAAMHSGKVLDVTGASTADGANVQQWTDWNGPNQHWLIQDLGGGWCKVVNVNSGEVLDVQGGVTATQDGANVEQWPWVDPGADNERWQFVDVGGATTPPATIASFAAAPASIVAGTAATLSWSTSDATSVTIDNGVGTVATSGSVPVSPTATTTYTLSASGGGATVTATATVTVTAPPPPPGPVTSGHVYAVIAEHSGKALDVRGGPGATQDGVRIQQWAYGGGANQRWRIDAHADGSYTFTALNSGKVLDVTGSSTVAGAAVIQWTDHDGANQRWNIVDAGGGWYRVVNVNSGQVLDVQGGVTATQNGANVEQWPWVDPGADNERWKFVAADTSASTAEPGVAASPAPSASSGGCGRGAGLIAAGVAMFLSTRSRRRG